MLFIGAIVRVYWSCSPPPVWEDEPLIIQYLSMIDVFASPLFWLAVVFTSIQQKKQRDAELNMDHMRRLKDKHAVPVHFTWPVLSLSAVLLGVLGTRFLPPIDQDESWPYADVVVVCNMILEGYSYCRLNLIACAKYQPNSLPKNPTNTASP